MVRPPSSRRVRHGKRFESSIVACARAGADVLSIESVGGKEVHDQALLYGDIHGVIFALGVLAPRDMDFLWRAIVRICNENRVVPGRIRRADLRIPRCSLPLRGCFRKCSQPSSGQRPPSGASLPSHGGGGPSKDCAYEGPVIKAITGAPISMEGSRRHAHISVRS